MWLGVSLDPGAAMRVLVTSVAAIFIGATTAAGQAAGTAGQAVDTVSRQETLPARVVADAAAAFNARSTIRLRGNAVIPRDSVVAGNVAVLDGSLRIGGHVRGRVVAINSNVLLEPTARVDRDILVVGGSVSQRENGRVRDGIRTYENRMVLVERADSIVPDERYSDEGKWWSDFQLDTPGSRSKVTVRGETYNRVEGLPILVGPSFRRVGERFRTELEVLGIIRSADRFEWDSDNLGHQVTFSTRMNREKGLKLGGSLFDVVEPVERWQFSDNEAGMATFVLHRDFRDYYGRHGGALHLTLFRGFERELELGYSNERWRSRDARDTWTLFRDSRPWRPNPEVNDGEMHVLSATLRVDTRNSELNPWTGWFVDAVLERGQGDLDSPGTRGVFVPSTYSRAMIDFRRYNRVSPSGQLNMRLVYGARLGDDELPLQKRFSVGGPGSLPGFDFRRLHDGDVDVGMCSTGPLTPGEPALCERMAVLQVEYRGDIHIDLFDSESHDEGNWRDVGRHTGSQWVLFADAGRGWMVDGGATPDVPGLTYSSGTVLPRLGTFRTDVGVGLDLGAVGVFVAKSVSHTDAPANFFVRLRHRF
jgi:hypothetical protein